MPERYRKSHFRDSSHGDRLVHQRYRLRLQPPQEMGKGRESTRYPILSCCPQTEYQERPVRLCAYHRVGLEPSRLFITDRSTRGLLLSSAYNFPVQLAVGPFIGAIAAGNTAVLKPSENAPSVAAVVQRIVESALDPTCYGIVQGGVAETTFLLDQEWDKIFYTGSQAVGKIIAKRAAETLTPVTLELGGRNPAIVTKHANARLAARRLLWGKTVNAGQVCVSHNYTLVDKDILPAFVAEMKIALQQFYPQGAKASRDYGRIINARQWTRLKRLVDESKGTVLMGGEMDESDKFIEPTLIQVNDFHDSLVMEETFGPLMPIIPVDDLDHAIRIVSEVHSTPLGIYPFGTKQESDRVLQEIRSGGASVNDAYFHGTIPTLPFGGVGDSGHGNYRGKASFECFSHRRSITTTPWWVEKLFNIRYPPYEGKLAKIRKMSELKPNFDREGKVNFSWVIYLLTLGAGSLMGGLTRHAVIILGKGST